MKKLPPGMAIMSAGQGAGAGTAAAADALAPAAALGGVEDAALAEGGIGAEAASFLLPIT